MSSEIATYDRVRSAAEQLIGDGKEPSYSAIHALIGGGSKLTILNHRDVTP